MWKIVDKVDSVPEILLYGEISEYAGFEHDTVASPDFARALAELNGSDVTVRINSVGGDVFAAAAMYNSLKSHNGKVTVIVDGLAASAASIVVMAGDEVVMPANALMMIHNPMAGMADYYTADDLTKQAEALSKIKESIITAYMSRAKVDKKAIAKMMDEETWLDARECVDLGFADRIEGSVAAILNRNALVINNASYDVQKLHNLKALRQRVKGGNLMDEAKLTAVDKAPASAPAVTPAPLDAAAIAAEAVAAERKRVAELDKALGESSAINAVINVAKTNGAKLADIQPYLDAIARAEAVPDAAKSVSRAISADIADSGAAEVAPSPAVQDSNRANDEIKASVDRMVGFFNAKTTKTK